MRRSYIIVLLIVAAVSAYFFLTPLSEGVFAALINNKSKTVEKPSGEPVTAPESSFPASPGHQGSPGTVGAVPVPNPKSNPDHGQPGHRCDIKVGDPLPPGSSSTPQTSISPPPAASKQNAPAVLPKGAASAKLNPAHGVAGHRCDIQVGSPLPAS